MEKPDKGSVSFPRDTRRSPVIGSDDRYPLNLLEGGGGGVGSAAQADLAIRHGFEFYIGLIVLNRASNMQ